MCAAHCNLEQIPPDTEPAKEMEACVNDADTFYCIVDMHAITVQHDPKDLLEATRRCTIQLSTLYCMAATQRCALEPRVCL